MLGLKAVVNFLKTTLNVLSIVAQLKQTMQTSIDCAQLTNSKPFPREVKSSRYSSRNSTISLEISDQKVPESQIFQSRGKASTISMLWSLRRKDL